MSDRETPPAGEEIHLPGGSVQPLLVAIGVTVALVGITTNIVLVIFGVVLTVGTVIRWIADARGEIEELPLHSEDH